jgi:hypothetical protein
MPIGFAYQVVKDFVTLVKMEEADPIDPGTLDLQQLSAMGVVEEDDGNNAYSWVRPRRLFTLTEAPDASHEVVWVTDKLRRTKRKVVRLSHSGDVEQVLIRKKT